jgi:hypothetical protein
VGPAARGARGLGADRAGTDESVVGPRQLERFRRALGDRLRVVEVPGGHEVLWDAFEETSAAVSAFLGEA